MTGRDDELLPEGVPAFDDPAYDALRDELADLGDAGPMPADVAARLDDVLAGLRAPTDVRPLGDAPVVPLRRRRNTGRRLLVAAAAVVAVGGGGVGLANVVQNSGGHSDMATADDSGAVSAPESAAGGDTGSTAQDGVNTLDGVTSGYAASLVPQLSTGRFASDADALIRKDAGLRIELQRAARMPAAQVTNKDLRSTTDELAENFDNDRDGLAAPTQPGPESPPADGGAVPDALTDGSLNRLQSCALSQIRGGVARAVLLDGSPAILVVYPARDGTRLVQARSCDANTVLISASVPVG